MNRIFVALIAIAFVFTGYRQVTWSPPAPAAIEAPAPAPVPDDPILARLQTIEAELTVARAAPIPPVRTPMDELTAGMLTAAKTSVDLAISLIGAMALFLGLMKVAEKGGLLVVIAKLLRPLMVRLFPEVPPDHPAMGAMILNFSANALGLANAATPFGIRAMKELDSLNPNPGTATNAMVLFLALNTSGLALLPTGVMAIRGTLGSEDPGGIIGTTLFATLCSSTVAVFAALIYQRFVADNTGTVPTQPKRENDLEDSGAYPLWVSATALCSLFVFAPLAIIGGPVISPWVIPVLAVSLVGYGAANGVKVYEAFVEGAKEGFEVAVMIIPYLVAILVAVGMLRSSGALGAFVGLVGPVTGAAGMPAEALPMALLRPLSGSGAYGIMMDILSREGPDSYVGYLVSTLQGSTETTFYVIAVYFGAVNVQRIRHALAAALTADAAGIVGAVIGTKLYFWATGM
ncbi:MAG: spore maturation protein SpmA [Myxococcota bacterium]|jgi:spore maturation protein SpmA